jgi:hypothetical protein
MEIDMGENISPTAPEQEAGVATAEQGVVLLDGPDGVAIAMTIEAALGTAHSLLAAAGEAVRQRDAKGQSN